MINSKFKMMFTVWAKKERQWKGSIDHVCDVLFPKLHNTVIMAKFVMCQLVWVMACPDWSNIILEVSVMAFWSDINI